MADFVDDGLLDDLADLVLVRGEPNWRRCSRLLGVGRAYGNKFWCPQTGFECENAVSCKGLILGLVSPNGDARDGTLLVLLSYSPRLCGSCFLRRILKNEPARSEGFRWLGQNVAVVAWALAWQARAGRGNGRGRNAGDSTTTRGGLVEGERSDGRV